MKLLLFLALCSFFIIHLEAKNCTEEVSTEDCNETEYTSYVECIRKRMKRSLDCENSVQNICDGSDGCENSCQQCDCDFCAINACQASCNSCCPNNPPCTTNRCCHKTCHARCKSSTCRSDCRKTCYQKITGGGSDSTSNITSGAKSRHNITTVINLKNIINNTNIIDVPIQLNNTNVNNITLGEDESTLTGQVGTSISGKETCCHVVSPRQCVPTEKYPFIRCFHIRKKVCGVFCRAPIVHAQPHEICDQSTTGTSCHQQVMYIPQPQPRCAYQRVWPYVNCGIQQRQFCGGCYVHYSSPFPQLPPPGCSPGCYDDGYGMGPYYRQGPFYRPGYAHVPSCFQVGTCGPYGYGGGYGGYGAGYGGYGAEYGGYAGGYSSYGGYGNPASTFGNFGGFGGFPNVGYPFNTYENNVHVETDPNNVTPRANSSSGNRVEVEEPPPSPYYPAPIVPQYSAFGYPYPYPSQVPAYNLPPEVDIQATISHPEKDSRYAQITINKEHNKRESENSKEESSATSSATTEQVVTSDPVFF